MKFKILFCLILVHTTEGCSFYYTGMTDFKNLGLLGEQFEYPNYWELPKVTLKNTDEEAIMLIGGTEYMPRFQNFKRNSSYTTYIKN